MSDHPISAVLAALERVTGRKATRNGSGWKTRCPAHDDKRPSLTVSEGDDGRALVHCHAGCTAEAIVKALGRTMRDLMAPRVAPEAHGKGGNVAPRRATGGGAAPPRPTAPDATSDALGRDVAELAAECAARLHADFNATGRLWTTRAVDERTARRFGVGVTADGCYWTFPVVDAGGRVVALKHHRIDPSGDGNKCFWIPKGVASRHVWPVYLDAPGPVWLCSGELKGLAVVAAGRSAVGITGGEAAELPDGLADVLAGRFVAVVGDEDAQGHKWERATLAALRGAGLDVRAVDLGLSKAHGLKDIGDWIVSRVQEGKEPAEIAAELDAKCVGAKLSECVGSGDGLAVLVRVADVQPEPVSWLWPDRIPSGKLVLFVGDPSTGKSFLSLDVAARVTTGAGWPDAPGERCKAGGVVILSAEDDLADTIRPRLDAAGADVSRIVLLKAVRVPDAESGGTRQVPFTLSADLLALEEAISAVEGCQLVIVDPISAYLGGGPRFDSHRNTDVRMVLAPLVELAARRRVAVLGVQHLRKGEGKALYRITGSLAFVAQARAVWAVARDPDDPGRRLFLPVKWNLTEDTTGLAFTIRSFTPGAAPVVAWERAPVSVTADDAIGVQRGRPGPKPEQHDEAVAWLRDALAGGPRLAKELYEEAREGQGISRRTLERGRQALGVVAWRPQNPGPWWWRLPDGAHRQHTAKSPSAKELGDLGGLPWRGQKAGFLGGAVGPGGHTAKFSQSQGLAGLPPSGDGCPDGEAVSLDVLAAGAPNAELADDEGLERVE